MEIEEELDRAKQILKELAECLDETPPSTTGDDAPNVGSKKVEDDEVSDIMAEEEEDLLDDATETLQFGELAMDLHCNVLTLPSTFSLNEGESFDANEIIPNG